MIVSQRISVKLNESWHPNNFRIIVKWLVNFVCINQYETDPEYLRLHRKTFPFRIIKYSKVNCPELPQMCGWILLYHWTSSLALCIVNLLEIHLFWLTLSKYKQILFLARSLNNMTPLRACLIHPRGRFMTPHQYIYGFN